MQIFSEKNNLPVRNPENLNNDEEYNFITSLSADIAIVVAYGKLIPKNLLNTTKFGLINIHASLLPKWRGAAPIQRAIMNEDKKTGITIMKIEEKLDSGPLLTKKELSSLEEFRKRDRKNCRDKIIGHVEVFVES